MPTVVRVGDRLQVTRDAMRVRALCRRAGISADNDSVRQRVLGQIGEVIKVDPKDATVKMRFNGSTTAWFPAGALGRQVVGGQQQDMYRGNSSSSTSSTSSEVVSEESYSTVEPGPNGTQLLKVVTTRRLRDGRVERSVQTQKL